MVFCLECASYPSLRALSYHALACCIYSYLIRRSSNVILSMMPLAGKQNVSLFQIPMILFPYLPTVPKILPHIAVDCEPPLSVNSTKAII